MEKIRVKTPAKINLTLEILGQRKDGYHDIKSVMQAVNLFDHIDIKVEDYHNKDCHIELSGNSEIIPYNRTNLAYIAAFLFIQKTAITHKKISIYIEKHIPVSAGMAGGSTNAAGVLFGLNEIFGRPLSAFALSIIASKIGSDVSFCLNGGTQLATSRGEVLKKLPSPAFDVVVASPKSLYIPAREAYEKYASQSDKLLHNCTDKLVSILKEDTSAEDIAELMINDLEKGILPDYPLLEQLKDVLVERGCLNSLMSGSGPCVFGIHSGHIALLNKIKDISFIHLHSINYGASLE